MTAWVTYRNGVYMQGLVGVYSSRKKACDAAIAAQKYDDGYHAFHVLPVEVDTLPEPTCVEFGGRFSGVGRKPQMVIFAEGEVIVDGEK